MTGWWWRSGSNKEARQVATAEDGNVLQDVAPDSIRRVHLLGVAGTGMGSFAGLLKAKGYVVSGSDNDVYPPMSEMLAGVGHRGPDALPRRKPRRGEARLGGGGQRHPPCQPRGDGGARARPATNELPGSLWVAVSRRPPPGGGDGDARKDDDVGPPVPPSWSPRAWTPRFSSAASLKTEAPASGSGMGRTSSSRAMSTTPPISTRGPNSCTTGRGRRCSPASSSTTRTFTATRRTTSRPSKAS